MKNFLNQYNLQQIDYHRLQSVHGKNLKVLNYCQNKCVTNDHLYYEERINNKKLLFHIASTSIISNYCYSFCFGTSCHYLSMTSLSSGASSVSTESKDFCATA